ncbi:MAG: Clp1/GlmU family protein [Deltaproteobacteria bacterium]
MQDQRYPFREEVEEMAAELKGARRILIWGEMGSGKSTLAMSLSRRVAHAQILALDPGTPSFGIPGAVCRGWWGAKGHKWDDAQALCTLDASRFRLPLVLAARRLLSMVEQSDDRACIIIDPPGVVRGVGGAELLMALVESLYVDTIVALRREDSPVPLAGELASFPLPVRTVLAASEAKRPARKERELHRTGLWDHFLAGGAEQTLSLDRVHLLGTPPPTTRPEAWSGRQVGLLNRTGDTEGMGEVVLLKGEAVTLRVGPGTTEAPAGLLIRDAGRLASGRLATLPSVHSPFVSRDTPVEMTPPEGFPERRSRPIATRLGSAWATLVGGVLGDPLVHVRFRNVKESLLFDLGDPLRLAAKVAHQVAAVCLSHAHLDHIGGFLWFLRSRIGTFDTCRIFGPSKTIARIEGFLEAITWDRIQENAPIFEVCEFDGNRLRRARLRPGQVRVWLPEVVVEDGIIHLENHYRIRAVVCDHHIPSVAYAVIFPREIHVRKERLTAFGLKPGPWLNALKRCIAAEKPDAPIELPNKETRTAGELAEMLTFIRPGKTLAYVADVADTRQNRARIIDLARSAHTLFCEAAFAQGDKSKADASQHLTTLAAAQIAREARVERLVPFHFSRRYERNPSIIYDEISAELPASSGIRIMGSYPP